MRIVDYLAFSTLFGHPTVIDFSRIKPSAENESASVPPGFLMILM